MQASKFFPPSYEKGQPICPFTEEPMKEPSRLKCGHVFDRINIERWVRERQSCPNCRQLAQLRDIQPIQLEKGMEVKQERKVADVVMFARKQKLAKKNSAKPKPYTAPLFHEDYGYVQRQIRQSLFARPV